MFLFSSLKFSFFLIFFFIFFVISIQFNNQNILSLNDNKLFHLKSSLIISCNGLSQPHIMFSLPISHAAGGFGDRLGGIITTFYHSIVTESSYSIRYNKPYELKDYFILPNCTTQLREHQLVNRGIIDFFPYYGKGNFVKDIGKNLIVRTNSQSWASVVRNPKFKEVTSRLGIDKYSSSQLFQAGIDTVLIGPQDILKNAFSKKLSEMKSQSYIGVQLRLGGGNVGWDDLPRHSLDSIECFVTEVISLIQMTGLSSIFLTGDSEKAIDRFKSSFQIIWKKIVSSSNEIPIIYENNGKIAHTDRSSVEQGTTEIWLKSILDWWMLRHASALVISRSGFGESAAWSSHTLQKSRKNGIPLSRSFYFKENTTESIETEDEVFQMRQKSKQFGKNYQGKDCIFYNTFYSRNDLHYFGVENYHVSKWFI